VIAFRAPAVGTYHGQLNLTHADPALSKEVSSCGRLWVMRSQLCKLQRPVKRLCGSRH
jgi:hypothetical protein